MPVPQDQRPPCLPLRAHEDQLLSSGVVDEVGLLVVPGRLDGLGSKEERRQQILGVGSGLGDQLAAQRPEIQRFVAKDRGPHGSGELRAREAERFVGQQAQQFIDGQTPQRVAACRVCIGGEGHGTLAGPKGPLSPSAFTAEPSRGFDSQ